MYMVIRRYRLEENSVKTAADKTREAFLSVLGKLPGFQDYYYVHAERSVIVVSFFEKREQAEESTRTAGEWIKKNMPDIYEGPPEILSGEVLFRFSAKDAQKRAA